MIERFDGRPTWPCGTQARFGGPTGPDQFWPWGPQAQSILAWGATRARLVALRHPGPECTSLVAHKDRTLLALRPTGPGLLPGPVAHEAGTRPGRAARPAGRQRTVRGRSTTNG